MKITTALVACSLSVVLSAASLSAQVAPPATGKFDPAKATPYRITRQDVLAVSVFGEGDLTTGGNRVENVGTISLQLIKEVHVVGLTVAEAQAKIESAYRDGRYLRNPQVKITIEQYAPRQVMIQGKVNSPGKHDLPPDQPMTIKELIFKAGGFQDTAAGTRVRITRTMPDGKNVIFEKNVHSAIVGRNNTAINDAEFLLEPDDVVYVPEKII